MPTCIPAIYSSTNRAGWSPSTASLVGKIRASNDSGKLRIENLSTTDLDVDGVSASGATDGTSTDVSSIGGNTVRRNLVTQFNDLRDQLDKFADDASFNGINLLRGDKLKLTTIPAAEWAEVENAALKFWDEIAAESELKAKVVSIFKEYNQILKKAGGVYTQG